MALKSAYDLAQERMIAPKHPKLEEKAKTFDFIKVDEFDDREDKTVDVTGFSDGRCAKETQLMTGREKPMEVRIQQPETLHPEEALECYIVGSTKSYSGYSKMNRNLIFGLSNHNVKVKVEDMSSSFDVNDSTIKEIEFLENIEVSKDAPKIYSMTVPSSVTHEGRKIAYTMMESSSLHKDYCDKLNLMDEIWVPSNFGKELFKDKVYPPVYVMPLGVDIDRYKPDCGVIDFGQASRGFKFLNVSKYSSRKGLDILLTAFLEEFSGEEDVSLILVSGIMELSAGKRGVQAILDDFKEIKSRVKKSEEELPHVALCLKHIQEKDMPKIYNSCQAFASISLGEGFNLCLMEAASTGLPVIASNVTAHKDYLDQDNSFLVEPEGYLKASVSGNLSQVAKSCHFYENQMFPCFGRKSIEQVKENMRFVYNNYSLAKIKADKLRNLVVNNYSWNKTIEKLYNRLTEIEG